MKLSVRSSVQNLLILVALFAVVFSGCGKSANVQQQAAKAMITVKGSDTMVHLVSSWSENFMKLNPNITVSVTGGGSGTGIAALLNGTTDIAASSRDIKKEEMKLAEEKGLDLKEVTVGKDAISIVVHPENPVESLTMQQIKDLFTGKITNWKEVGGPDKPVLLYSRESSSGTYAFFQEHVLEKQDYAPTARLMPATSGIIEAVAADKGGIGYVGLGYAENVKDKIKVLPVKAKPDATAVLPSEESVLNGSYPIARALYLYLSKAASEAAQQFTDYALSSDGQQVVKESGYIGNPKS